MEKHPMAILSQLLKGLSVGSEQENYFYPYDAMQRTYRYRHKGTEVERATYPTTANLEKLLNSFNQYKSDWVVQLGQGCLPESLISKERQAIVAAGYQGFIKFKIEARRIPAYSDLSQFEYTAYANSGNSWNVKQIAGDDIESAVDSEEQMWAAFAGFDTSKNVALLKQAAIFLLDNYSAADAKNALLQAELDDASKRDLIFALGLTGRDDAEGFMLDVLNAMPTNSGVAADLQKVRLMVSLSSNDKVTRQSFETFSSLVNNPDESANVRNNALINMGTTVKTLEAAGEATSALQDQLKQQVSSNIEAGGNQSASAILAAGNAQLSGLERPMQVALTSANSKERYAAATVLSRDSGQQQLLIEHIATEPSDLITNAILANWDRDRLTGDQRLQLQQIADNSTGQKAQMIERFLNP
jgi:hypothetical protein